MAGVSVVGRDYMYAVESKTLHVQLLDISIGMDSN